MVRICWFILVIELLILCMSRSTSKRADLNFAFIGLAEAMLPDTLCIAFCSLTALSDKASFSVRQKGHTVVET